MKQLKAYKFRIYPSNEQKIFFSKTFGCVRLVYNLMLNERIKAYEESKGSPDKKIKYPTPAKYKKEYEFLKAVDSARLSARAISLLETPRASHASVWRSRRVSTVGSVPCA